MIAFVEDVIGADREALSARRSHSWTADGAAFGDANVVASARLVPVMGLAERLRGCQAERLVRAHQDLRHGLVTFRLLVGQEGLAP